MGRGGGVHQQCLTDADDGLSRRDHLGQIDTLEAEVAGPLDVLGGGLQMFYGRHGHLLHTTSGWVQCSLPGDGEVSCSLRLRICVLV